MHWPADLPQAVEDHAIPTMLLILVKPCLVQPVRKLKACTALVSHAQLTKGDVWTLDPQLQTSILSTAYAMIVSHLQTQASPCCSLTFTP